MDKKEFILIEKDVLKSFIKKANCWDAMVRNSKATKKFSFKTCDWNLIFIKYAEDRGISKQNLKNGITALNLLTDIDLGVIQQL